MLPHHGRDSSLQAVATDTALWSDRNGMELNVEKTKEMMASFSKKHLPKDIPPITISGRELERIKCAKVLG